jgi:hypothetical protein
VDNLANHHHAAFLPNLAGSDCRFMTRLWPPVDLIKRLRALGETNSTWLPSENCNIQILWGEFSSPCVATTPVIVFPTSSKSAFIILLLFQCLSLEQTAFSIHETQQREIKIYPGHYFEITFSEKSYTDSGHSPLFPWITIS